MDKEKESFLKNEFLTMSVFGALGRSNTYSDSASENDKQDFRNGLREQLREIGSRYYLTVTEEKHLANIVELSDALTSKFSSCLKNGRFRIGIAQKALNLYLKYLWCANFIPAPPHCPFDSIIIGYLPECGNLNWTTIDNVDDYLKLVKAAKNVAKDRTIAEWEMRTWGKSPQNKANQKRSTANEKDIEKSAGGKNRQQISLQVQGNYGPLQE